VRAIVDFVVALTDLLEAEAQALRQGAVKLGIGLGLVMVGATLLLGALGLLIASAFIGISCALGPAIAALLTGSGLLLVAVIVMLVAKWMSK
jgi:hypothetical protein